MTDYPSSVYYVFHPDPFHVPTFAEREAFQVAAAHHWAVDTIMRGIPLPWPARLELTRYPDPLERVLRFVRREWPTELTDRQERIVVAAWWDSNNSRTGARAAITSSAIAPRGPIEPGMIQTTPAYACWFAIDPYCPHHGKGTR